MHQKWSIPWFDPPSHRHKVKRHFQNRSKEKSMSFSKSFSKYPSKFSSTEILFKNLVYVFLRNKPKIRLRATLRTLQTMFFKEYFNVLVYVILQDFFLKNAQCVSSRIRPKTSLGIPQWFPLRYAFRVHPRPRSVVLTIMLTIFLLVVQKGFLQSFLWNIIQPSHILLLEFLKDSWLFPCWFLKFLQTFVQEFIEEYPENSKAKRRLCPSRNSTLEK